VLRVAGSGASLPEIAEALFLSPGTVRAHLEHLRRKLGARNQVELALLARASGVFTLTHR
jgi:DNA-binding CsgD family transcriptional regulator